MLGGIYMEEALNFLDCNCSFGRRSIVEPGSFYKIEDLVHKMEYYGIKRALVYHAMAQEYSPLVGNSMLMEEIKGYGQLIPVWAVMHHHTEEFYEPDVLKDRLRENGIRAVTMFPGRNDQGFSTDEWNCGELFDMLEENSVPLIIGLDQVGIESLLGILKNHPGLKVILKRTGYSLNRNLYGILKKFKNLYIESSGYKVHHNIEVFVRMFGAHRLVFGSGMPFHAGGSAVCNINYARISDEEKNMIAWKNLEGILGGVKW